MGTPRFWKRRDNVKFSCLFQPGTTQASASRLWKNPHSSLAPAHSPRTRRQAPKQVELKVESVTLVSPRIWQGFLPISILVSPWLFQEGTGSGSGESVESHQPWEGPLQPPSFKERWWGVGIWVCREGCDKTFQDSTRDTDFWAGVLWWTP